MRPVHLYAYFLLLLIACHQQPKQQLTLLQQRKIDSVKRDTYFLPLVKDQAYQFINQYYLPHLDSMPCKRKILLNPLSGYNFSKLTKLKIHLIVTGKDSIVLKPPFAGVDSLIKWDKQQLKNVVLINYSTTNNQHASKEQARAEWEKKYGEGVMLVSYPLYNPYTHILIISEWLETRSYCATGANQVFVYYWTGKIWEKR